MESTVNLVWIPPHAINVLIMLMTMMLMVIALVIRDITIMHTIIHVKNAQIIAKNVKIKINALTVQMDLR